MPQEIHSISKALTILEALSSHGPLGVSELSARLGMHKSVVSKMLTTMRKHGFVRLLPETGRYDLGMRLFALGQQMKDRLPFRKAVLPHVENLGRVTGETAFVAIWENDEIQYLCDYVSDQPIRLGARAGLRKRPWHDAAGKAILAAWEPDLLTQAWRKARASGEDGLPPLKRLTQELAAIRQMGYVVEREHNGLLIAVAAAIPHFGRAVTSALAVGGPAARMEQALLASVGELVAQRAKRLAIDMGLIRDDAEIHDPVAPSPRRRTPRPTRK